MLEHMYELKSQTGVLLEIDAEIFPSALQSRLLPHVAHKWNERQRTMSESACEWNASQVKAFEKKLRLGNCICSQAMRHTSHA
jgi:hypothetical protein